MDPVVLHLYGMPSTGKTSMLERIADGHPGRLQLLSPAAPGDVLDPGLIRWTTHSCVAIDDLASWDRPSLVARVAAIEAAAAARQRSVILVTTYEDDLRCLNVTLRSAPIAVHVPRHGSETLAFCNYLALRCFVLRDEVKATLSAQL